MAYMSDWIEACAKCYHAQACTHHIRCIDILPHSIAVVLGLLPLLHVRVHVKAHQEKHKMADCRRVALHSFVGSTV